jgi:hypothetical protein
MLNKYDPFLVEAICRGSFVVDETATPGVMTKRFIALMKNFANKHMESRLSSIFIPSHLNILDGLNIQRSKDMSSPLIDLNISVYTESQQECWKEDGLELPENKKYWVLGVTIGGLGFLGAF